jgi:hypothetical protein
VDRSSRPTSPQTSYRRANRNYAGGTKESDEHEVALRRRKTNTKRTQRRERGQLSQERYREIRLAALKLIAMGQI